MKHGNYAVLDCETGGLDPEQTPITQFAIIVLHRESLEEIVRWQTFLKPYDGLVVDPEVLKKTTVTKKDIRNGMEIKEFCDKLEFLLRQKEVRSAWNGKFANFHAPVIVGHNVSFDIAFIRKAFQVMNREAMFTKLFSHNNGVADYMDTMKLSKMMWDGQLKTGDDKGINLGAVCKRVGVNLVGAHGAMEDTQATAEVFKHFTNLLRGDKAAVTTATQSKEIKNRETFQF